MIAYQRIYQRLAEECKVVMDQQREKHPESCERETEAQGQDQEMEPELCLSDNSFSDQSLHEAHEQTISDVKQIVPKKQKKHVQDQTRPLRFPLERQTYRLSSRFGSRKKRNGSWGYHYGIDMASPRGTTVKAAASGRIIEAGYSSKGYGKTIVISHPDIKYQTRYAHLDKILARVGQEVKVGQKIGLVGATGFVISENGSNDASHLHFEVKKRGKHIDPLCVLS